jgi:serine/threonine-protein kinase
MLSSRVFASSARLSKFLVYIVEAALAGKKAANEYLIGVEVFKRDKNFDPRVDPIVRVHARRLRSKLAQYYETEGVDDTVDIHVPLRTYIPVFRCRPRRAPVSTQSSGITSQPHPLVQSVAVFPFVNLSNERAEDYFVDGLTREVIHALSRVKNLRVVAWTAQERRPHVHDIARQLQVQAALRGTLRGVENGLRISAELIGIPDGTVLWSQMYEVRPENVIATQEMIARAICEALSHELEHLPGNKSPQVSTQTYQLHLKGCYECKKLDRRSLERGMEYLQQSIAASPRYAPSHAALAEALVSMVLYSEASPHEAMRQAKAEAQLALECDANSADAHTSIALVHAFYNCDMRHAEAEFLHAIELAPNSATALQWYASACLGPRRRFDEAIAHLRHAQELDPLMLTIPHHLGFVLCASGHPEVALDQLYEYLDLEPSFHLTHWSLGFAHLVTKQYARAIEEFEIASALSHTLSYAESSLAHACALAGDRRRAATLLAELIDKSQHQYVPSLDVALVHVGLRQFDDAIQQLEAAHQECCAWLIRANIDPRLDPLRGRPDFQRFIGSLHLDS